MSNDSEDGTHRVVNKRFVVSQGADRPIVWEVGDIVSPEPEWVETHPDRFEPVGDEPAETPDDEASAEASSGSDPEGSDGETAIPNTSEWTVSDLRDWATSNDDPSAVESALADERENKNRATAIDALEARLNALTDGGE